MLLPIFGLWGVRDFPEEKLWLPYLDVERLGPADGGRPGFKFRMTLKNVPDTDIEKVVFVLHPFDDQPIRELTKPPFVIESETVRGYLGSAFVYRRKTAAWDKGIFRIRYGIYAPWSPEQGKPAAKGGGATSKTSGTTRSNRADAPLPDVLVRG